jgi:hypothetical protein
MGIPRVLFLALVVPGSACSLFLPARKDPASEAREKEAAVCPPDRAPEYPENLFDARSIVRVEEIYSSVRTGRSGSEARLQGAKLRLRPIAGMTTNALEALLLCHQARRLLGRSGEVELPSDPYWLPESWLDITVESEGGNFVVSVRGPDTKTANEILSRAMAFAASAPSFDNSALKPYG